MVPAVMGTALTYVTHSISTDNEAAIATGWLPGELSTEGRRLAVEQRVRFADADFEVVYTSDLRRAVQTAELGFAHHFPVVSDARLRECDYGALNGAPVEVVRAERESHLDVPFPDGESYRDVERRIASFVADVRVRHPNGRVGIVSHHAPHLALCVVVLGRTWEQAFAEDWQRTGDWQPSWEFELD